MVGRLGVSFARHSLDSEMRRYVVSCLLHYNWVSNSGLNGLADGCVVFPAEIEPIFQYITNVLLPLPYLITIVLLVMID